MATETDHIRLANHNHGLLLHLLANGGYPLKIAKYKGIAKDYSHLLTASRIARYLSAHGQGEFHTFTDFLDNDGVKTLIRKRLYGVEQRSLAFLTNAGKKDLLKIDPARL